MTVTTVIHRHSRAEAVAAPCGEGSGTLRRALRRIVTLARSLTAFLACAWLVMAGEAMAQAGKFELADEQLARLGVALARPEPVQEMEIVSAPAEVVVPPARQALISAPLDGLVARVLVAEGEPVAQGQPVAELEGPEFLSWQREYLDAMLESELADAQQQRDRALFDEGIIAERRLQEATARARAGRARLDQARRQLELAGFASAAITQLAQGGALQGRLVLRSPLNGVVLESFAAVGARVGALDAVARVGDLSTLWLELSVPQEIAAQIEPGMRVRVSSGKREVLSTVTTVGSFVADTTQSVLVRAEVTADQSGLRAGQFVSATVISATGAQPALALPAAALTRNGGTSYVFVRRDGMIEALPVQVLADDGVRVYVAGALDGNARVAIEGISVLKSLWLAEAEAGS